ncbi:MAG: hypothetical protein K1X64_04020 [Myxococcaceae bacterium]|nr:hypothetical protein [Myxococcaceae bacterium]
MKARIAAAALSVLMGTGCIVVNGSGGGTGSSGDITMLWSFGGKTCTQAGVTSVQITMPGVTLEDNGVLPCSARGTQGGVLEKFKAGTYTFTIDGLGSNNEKLYSTSGTVTVNGNVTATVDLNAVNGANTYAYLSWSFPPSANQNNPSCQQVGVTDVVVYIDSQAGQRVGCSVGQSVDGSVTPYLSAGVHNVRLSALASNGAELYSFVGTFTTALGAPTAQAFLLQWSVGGVAVKWSLRENSAILSCAQAGVTEVFVNFQDAQNNLVYADAGLSQNCSGDAATFNLRPGAYKIFVQAAGSGDRLYQSNMAAPPSVNVTAGVFPSAASALTIDVPRTQ